MHSGGKIRQQCVTLTQANCWNQRYWFLSLILRLIVNGCSSVGRAGGLVIWRSPVRIPAPLGWNWATCRSILEQDTEPQNCFPQSLDLAPVTWGSWRCFIPPEKGGIKHLHDPHGKSGKENRTERNQTIIHSVMKWPTSKVIVFSSDTNG